MTPQQIIQQNQLLASVSQQYSTGSAGGLVTTPPMMVVQGGQEGMYPQIPTMAQVGQTQCEPELVYTAAKN
jgi:hypothetical protein